jgi:hypothetical protein
MHIGPVLNQQADRGRVIFGDGPHQRCLAGGLFVRVDLSATSKQKVENVLVANAGGRHHRRFARYARRVWVGPDLSRSFTIDGEPSSQASPSAVEPSSSAVFTLAPAPINVVAVPASSQWAAQCSAVDPSPRAAFMREQGLNERAVALLNSIGQTVIAQCGEAGTRQNRRYPCYCAGS